MSLDRVLNWTATASKLRYRPMDVGRSRREPGVERALSEALEKELKAAPPPEGYGLDGRPLQQVRRPKE